MDSALNKLSPKDGYLVSASTYIDNHDIEIVQEKLKFPIEKDSKIGEIKVFKKGKIVKTVDIYSEEEVNNLISLIVKYKIIICFISIIVITIRIKYLQKRKRGKRKIKISKIEDNIRRK